MKGSGHFTWRIYDERHGGTHFMHEGHSTSYLNGKHCEAPNGLGMPVYILRECPTEQGDVCDPVLSDCARSTGAAQLACECAWMASVADSLTGCRTWVHDMYMYM